MQPQPDDRPPNGLWVHPPRAVRPHVGPCDHGPCGWPDFLAIDALADPRCCGGHHPEAVPVAA